MIFRQFFDHESFTYTYLIADKQIGKAVLIDPVREKTGFYLQTLDEMKLQLTKVLDTHTHADHISANGELRDATGCTTLLGEQSESSCIDKRFNDGEKITLGDLTITALHTPGHTDDSYSFHLQDNGQDYLFTGDTLLIRGSGRTDFQKGDAHSQWKSIVECLLTYPDSTWVYPAHDYKGRTVSTIEEEKRCNPRLQCSNADDYAELMNNLHLPNPKMMDIAIPANQACGKN